jgi:hypothetical protein
MNLHSQPDCSSPESLLSAEERGGEPMILPSRLNTGVLSVLTVSHRKAFQNKRLWNKGQAGTNPKKRRVPFLVSKKRVNPGFPVSKKRVPPSFGDKSCACPALNSLSFPKKTKKDATLTFPCAAYASLPRTQSPFFSYSR